MSEVNEKITTETEQTISETKKVTIEEVKSMVKKDFPESWKQAEACLATIATLLLKNNANPTSLVLIGRPSAGKTTVLDFFKVSEDIIYRSDNFTPKAFVSHFADKKRDQIGEIDMLRRIEHKCLVIADLGVMFGKRKEDLAENLGILTRALDGSGLTTDSGVYGQRKYTGDKGDCMFAMLAATTPSVAVGLWDVMSRVGSRLLFLQMPNTHRSFNDIMKCFKDDMTYTDKRKECQKVISEYLTNLWKEKGGFGSVGWNDKDLPEEELRMIVKLATLLSMLRGVIPNRREDKNGEFQYLEPCLEDPRRATALMLNIARGRAILYGRNQINMDDIPILIDITLSSCTEERGKLFRAILEAPGHYLRTSAVEKALKCGRNAALNVMEDFNLLGIAEYIPDKTHQPGRPEKGLQFTAEVEILVGCDFFELISKNDADYLGGVL
jgi:hypothetical protein